METDSVNIEARREILEKILSGEISDKKQLERVKRDMSREFTLPKVPSNAEILATADEDEREHVIPLLQRKPVRSVSGVTVITVMPRPYPCPKDEPCIYCPGGPDVDTPQSYTGEEPASARAKQADYDPRKQVEARKEQLRAIGHEVDKVELIVFGGTFPAQPEDYQEEFIHSCLDAISGIETPNLETAKKKAETAETRTIGVTFETRPDYCMEEQIDKMLDLGGTRVEIGVQTTHQDVYDIVNREHTVQDVIDSTRKAKDSGMAVVHHVMPGLPGSTPERDLESFKRLFDDPNFRPDMLKIYPCLVVKGTELYEMWKSGDFTPIQGDEAVDLVAQMKKRVPKWVRIQRVQRDIPSGLIEAGVWKGNFRNIVQDKLEEHGDQCDCIRCREVGHQVLKEDAEPQIGDINLCTEEYEASRGNEVFISYEDLERNLIFGHLRLRIPSGEAHRPEVDEKTSLVRMLYVFGNLVPVGKEPEEKSWQHLGLGEKMLEEAERIASEEFDSKKMGILSGIGSRPYYRGFGYELDGPYMIKELE